jgi:hypothetical protein
LAFRECGSGRLSKAYSLSHALSDVNIPADGDYDQAFYENAIAKMKEIYAQNGIFVLLLHPEYFGFFEYLAHPKNWMLLISFFWRYFELSRSTRLSKESS